MVKVKEYSNIQTFTCTYIFSEMVLHKTDWIWIPVKDDRDAFYVNFTFEKGVIG